jgi:hypothetical protein
MGDSRNHTPCRLHNRLGHLCMDELTHKVRSALKMKWMNNDHNVNLKKMTEFYNTTPNVLKEIIGQYEAELLNTKFIIIE